MTGNMDNRVDYLVHLVYVKENRGNYLMRASCPIEAATEALVKWQELIFEPSGNTAPRPVGVVVFGPWEENKQGTSNYFRLLRSGELKPCPKEDLVEFLVQDEEWDALGEK